MRQDNETTTVIDLRFLIVTSLAAACLIAALTAWNRMQVVRMADSLLERAEDLSAELKWDESLKYISQYRKLRPTDSKAHVQFAQTFDHTAKSLSTKTQAIAQYDLAIGATTDPQLRRKLQQRQAELQLEVATNDPRRLTLVEQLAWELLSTSSDRAASASTLLDNDKIQIIAQAGVDQLPTLRLAAISLAQQARIADSKVSDTTLAACQKVLDLNPADLELVTATANLYRFNLNQPDEADKVIDRLLVRVCGAVPAPEETAEQIAHRIAQQPPIPATESLDTQENTAAALRLVHAYQTQFHPPADDAFLGAAIATAPDDFATRMEAGLLASQQARDQSRSQAARAEASATAVEHLEQAIRIDPKQRDPYLVLAETSAAAGDLEKAVSVLERGLGAVGRSDWPLNTALGNLLSAGAQTAESPEVRDERIKRAEPVIAKLREIANQETGSLTNAGRLARDASIALLQGRVHMARGNALAAIQVLKPAASDWPADSDTQSQIGIRLPATLLLGEACRQLGHWDEAALAYEKAMEIRPDELSHRLAAATARRSAGQYAAARQHLQTAVNSVPPQAQQGPEWLPAAWLLLVESEWQLHLAAAPTLALADQERLWAQLFETIRQAERWTGNSWQLSLLNAQIYLSPLANSPEKAEERRNSAIALLRQAEAAGPASPELWNGLLTVYELAGLPNEADRAASQYRESTSDGVAATLVRARLLLSRKRYDEAAELLASISAEDRAKAPAEQLVSLSRYETEIATRPVESQSATAQSLEAQKANLQRLKTLSAQSSQPLPLLEQTIMLAVQMRDWAEAEAAETRLKELEGPDGTTWRFYRATRLLSQQPNVTQEVRDLQQAIETARPGWPGGHVLAGLIASRDQKLDQASAALQRAYALGERNPFIFRALVELHTLKGEFAEADRYLAMMPSTDLVGDDLSPLRVAVAMGVGDWKEAEKRAKKGVESAPTDPASYLQLAQVLILQKRPEEAKKILLQAVKRFPQSEDTWKVLFGLLVAQGQKGQAKTALDHLVRNVPLDAARRELALAQGHELLGDLTTARGHYDRAVTEAPQDEVVLEAFASFMLSRHPEEAEERFEELLHSDAAQGNPSTAIRRALALVLANSGGRANWDRIAKLLEGQGTNVKDRRLKAVLLSKTGDPADRKAARQIVDELIQQSVVVNDADRLLMANLMESDNQPALAKDHYLTLASVPNPRVEHLTVFVAFLLRNDDLSEAERWITRLRELDPMSYEYCALHAKWLRLSDRTVEIEPFVEEFATEKLTGIQDAGAVTAIRVQIAEIYSGLGMPAQASRHLASTAAQSPDSYSQLAVLLAQQGKGVDAVQLCQKHDPVNDVRACLTLCVVLMSAPQDDQAQKLGEPILQQVITQRSGKAAAPSEQDVQVLSFVASVRHVQGRLDDAIGLNEIILKVRPDNSMVRNNLATALAEKPGMAERAMTELMRAIEAGGELPNFIDTKGMIYLQQEQFEKALECFEQIATHASTDPRYHFHRTIALDRLGRSADAQKYLRLALYGNLAQQILTPVERDQLTRLASH